MKIIKVEAKNYTANGKNGVEALAQFVSENGDEMTACVCDYEDRWFATAGYGFMNVEDAPLDETVCEFSNRTDAVKSEYGKVFGILSELCAAVMKI